MKMFCFGLMFANFLIGCADLFIGKIGFESFWLHVMCLWFCWLWASQPECSGDTSTK